MFALLEIARIYKARKLFADLQGPICYKDPKNKGTNLIVYQYNRVKFAYHFHINYDLNLQTAEFLVFALNSVQRKAIMSTIRQPAQQAFPIELLRERQSGSNKCFFALAPAFQTNLARKRLLRRLSPYVTSSKVKYKQSGRVRLGGFANCDVVGYSNLIWCGLIKSSSVPKKWMFAK